MPKTEAEERYEARDFASVVRLIGGLSLEQLLASPHLGFILADSARRVGGPVDVNLLTRAVVEAARAKGASDLLCDALNLYGIVLLDRGEAHAAERAWFELVNVATEADNPQYVARASNNLGIAAILGMRLDEAITSFQRSVAAYLRLAYSRGLAQSHQNLGIVYRELDKYDESHAHFQRAITWAYAADSLDDVARAELEVALLLIYSPERDVTTARMNAQQAFNRFEELVLPGDIAEALRVLGVIEIAAGNLRHAEEVLESALSRARAGKRRLLEAETLIALAAIAPPGRQYAFEQQAWDILGAMDAGPWGEQVKRRLEDLKI